MIQRALDLIGRGCSEDEDELSSLFGALGITVNMLTPAFEADGVSTANGIDKSDAHMEEDGGMGSVAAMTFAAASAGLAAPFSPSRTCARTPDQLHDSIRTACGIGSSRACETE